MSTSLIRGVSPRHSDERAAALAAISPWLLYSLHTFGTIRQASGVMKMLWMQDEVAGLGLGERLWLYASRYAQLAGLFAALDLGKRRRHQRGDSAGVAWPSRRRVGLCHASPAEVRQAIGRVFPSVAYPLLHVFVAGAIYSICFADVQCWYLALPYLECLSGAGRSRRDDLSGGDRR